MARYTDEGRLLPYRRVTHRHRSCQPKAETSGCQGTGPRLDLRQPRGLGRAEFWSFGLLRSPSGSATLSCLRGRCFTHAGMDLTYETLLLPAKREFPSFEATHVSILSPAMSTGSMSHLHSICWVFRYPQSLAPGTGFR